MTRGEERIAIVTDSTADLPPELAESWGIAILPLHIVFGDTSYRDGLDITPDEIYARIDKESPTTSAPSPQEAIALFDGLRERGFTHAIAVNISGALSRTVESVKLAASEVRGLATAVVDSRVISMGMGFIVLELARLAAEGKTSFAALVERAKAMVPHSNIMCVLKTLEYFRRGGRIGAVAAAAASVLSLKPIISMKDGIFYSPMKVRGRRQSLDALIELAREAVEAGANRVAVLHADALEEARCLLEALKGLPNVAKPVLGKLGATLGVHGGPGTIGICVARV